MAARDDRADKFSVLKKLAEAGLTSEQIRGLGKYKQGQDRAQGQMADAVRRRQTARRAGLKAIAGTDGRPQTPRGQRSIMSRAGRAGSISAAAGGDDRKSAVARRLETVRANLPSQSSASKDKFMADLLDRMEGDARQKRNAPRIR